MVAMAKNEGPVSDELPEDGSALAVGPAARGLIRSLADTLETRHAADALRAGQRAQMDEVLGLVDGLRRLAGPASLPAAADGSNEGAGEPLQRSVLAASFASAGSPGPRRSGEERTLFFRSESELVKYGQVGTRKEYRHVVPLGVVEIVVESIGAIAGGRGTDFAFEDVLDPIAEHGVKGYQARTTIAWLRRAGLVRMPSRGRYVAMAGLTGDAVAALHSLELESEWLAARAKGPESKSAGNGGRAARRKTVAKKVARQGGKKASRRSQGK